MRTRFFAMMAAGLLVLGVLAGQALALSTTQPQKPLAKNVIIMIADGAGFNQYKAGEFYQYGSLSAPFESFGFKKAVSTYPLGSSYDPLLAWSDFNWVRAADTTWSGSNNQRTYTNWPAYTVDPTAFITESDMAATAMATGLKTTKGVGWAPDPGASAARAQKSILEYAEDLGKSTGVVTTKFFDDATPAGFTAHREDREDYFRIANDMISSKTDVVMGSGNPYFGNDGQAVTPNWTDSGTKQKTYLSQGDWDALVAGTAGNIDADGDGVPDPWTLIESRDQFQALQTGATADRIFGLARSGKSLQEKRFEKTSNVLADPFVVPWKTDVPTLAEMVNGALNVLDNNPKGFVAMFEGGAADDAWHDGYMGRAIEEEKDFNDAVQAVIDWVTANSSWGQTLLIVTADHDTGYVWGPGSGIGTPSALGDPAVWTPIVNNGAGAMPGVAEYAALNTTKSWPYPLWHCNSLVPLFAQGDAARTLNSFDIGTDPVRGPYVDNTDIFRVMYRAIGYSLN